MVGTVLGLPFVGAYVVKEVVLPRVGQRLGCTIRVGAVRVWPTRVVLRRLRLRAEQSTTALDLITAPLVEVRFSPSSLLRGQLQIDEVQVDQAIVQIARSETEEDNVSSVLSHLRKDRETGSAGRGGGKQGFVRGPSRLLLSGAVVDVRDDSGSAHVALVNADVHAGGKSQAMLGDLTVDLPGGLTAQAGKVTVRFNTVPGRFFPMGLPDVEIEGGVVAPWKSLALTGIAGTISPDTDDASRAMLKLHGGYGGVDRTLWDASGWIHPGPAAEPLTHSRREAEADLKLRADRFKLSSLDPILKNTAVIDSQQAEVDASLNLHYAQHALDFDGSFHLAGLSLFTANLSPEPVRGLGFEITARGRADQKTRRIRLDRSVIRWRGAQAIIEAEAEAQPAKLQVIHAPGNVPSDPAQGPGWRERWRHVSAHVQVPPIPCQAALSAIPPEIFPRLQGFRLGGTFYTDLRVAVDFAQLLQLPPPPKQDDEEGEALDTPAAAPAPPVVRASAPKRRHRSGHRHHLPPLRLGEGEMAVLTQEPEDPGTGAAATSPGTGKGLLPMEPVTLTGKVGIDGCKVLAAPEDMNAERLLQSFVHVVEVEPEKVLSFVIGAENPDFVPFEEISPYLINSIMTTEDNGFMKHHGFIGPEFRSALAQNLQRGYFRLGASSITMQMVKNVLLSREKTLSRKLQELFLTWYLEQNLSKERILEIYFNAIEFGPYLYGIGKAVRHYFGKTPKELTPREAAWFSSILPSPKRRYVHFCKGQPDAKWEAYLSRILRRVHERGRLTDDEFNASMEERFTFNREEAPPERECLALIKRLTTPQQ